MALRLDTDVQYLKGVGPGFAHRLNARGIQTVQDLLLTFPRGYEDRRAARNIASLQPGEVVSLKAQIQAVQSTPLGPASRGKSSRRIYDILIRDASGLVRCRFFRVPFKGYFDRFETHQMVRVVGKVTDFRGRIEFHHPEITPWEDEAQLQDRLVALYSDMEGLTSNKLVQWLKFALHELTSADEIKDPLPGWIREKYNLIPFAQALHEIHFPPQNSGKEYLDRTSAAHRRLIFDDFFWMQVAMATRKAGILQEHAVSLELSEHTVEKIKTIFPFQLTAGQNLSLDEIVKDLIRPHPMHRLIQGDVGSGKTAVALATAALVATQGYQTALMAPTEILSEQHRINAEKLLNPLGIQVASLTGRQSVADRRAQLEKIRSGSAKLVVGTHALIQNDVNFASLALVIIDEQHRFGVHQRLALKQKSRSTSEHPHFLVMTATPIPRTLAMTVYGDLDISLIRERPAGRQPIRTRVTTESKRPQVIGYIRQHLQEGRQAYVICPLVEESEKIDLKNATDEHARISIELPEFRVGLLHGRMSNDEKDQIMGQFRHGAIHVLVATTVIEVGVDVPNATIMWVEHAERFGLSQLHQIRGRVGRGIHKSICILMLGHAVSDEGRERCAVMERTDDGFEIAEADLEMRGPGEFLGSRQSGLTGFKMASLIRDQHILQLAREAAQEVLRRDPRLKENIHLELREELVRQQGPVALSSIG